MATLNINRIFQNFDKKIDANVRDHLKNVYSCLSLCVLAATVGSYAQMYSTLGQGFGGVIGPILGIGLAMSLVFSSDNGRNRPLRLAMLLGFSLFSGFSLGPLLNLAIRFNPTIIPTAFLMSATVFVCFTGAALMAPDGYYLAMGGSLFAAMSSLFWLSVANIFLQFGLIYQVQLWMGLLLFCGFVSWDTQMIIEKRRMGDKDFIIHSLDLFIDFLSIFRKILVILLQKEENRDRKRRS